MTRSAPSQPRTQAGGAAWPVLGWGGFGLLAGLIPLFSGVGGCANITGIQAHPDGGLHRDGGLDATSRDGGAWDGDLRDGAASDACVGETQAALCTQSQVECGPLSVVDGCGQSRDIASCGTCSDGDCVSGACAAWTYSWQTDSWGACSEPCGGGSQTRSVWCQRNDGVTVADSYCSSPKPATSQACNTQTCPTRATATGLGSGSPDTGLQPTVTLLSGDMGHLHVQPYVTIGSDAYQWGLSCTSGPTTSCTLSCSGSFYGTYTPTPYDCFSDDEEWNDACTLTVECP